jgi:hypothetical protein
MPYVAIKRRIAPQGRTPPLARRFDAHLVGLHALEAMVVYPAISMHISGEGFAEYSKCQKVQLDEIRDIFERYTLRES